MQRAPFFEMPGIPEVGAGLLLRLLNSRTWMGVSIISLDKMPGNIVLFARHFCIAPVLGSIEFVRFDRKTRMGFPIIGCLSVTSVLIFYDIRLAILIQLKYL
jgi:hypothetical protein